MFQLKTSHVFSLVCESVSSFDEEQSGIMPIIFQFFSSIFYVRKLVGAL
jgi:hypothetical protein